MEERDGKEKERMERRGLKRGRGWKRENERMERRKCVCVCDRDRERMAMKQ